MCDAAVCIVADSSYDLAEQWRTVISSYVSCLLSRLHEGRSDDSLFIAVVTYATAHYYPTPIVAKRYFAAASPVVVKELKDNATLKLGIGRTGSDSKSGMAVLEGYAAALEMFDLFLSSRRTARDAPQDKQSSENQTGPLCHVIHIAACPPDDSQHPSWNQTTNLDALTWKTLPDEIRRRNINLNFILVEPNKDLNELHSSLNPDTHTAWFKAANDAHGILLSSQTSWAPIITKRPSETAEPEKAPEPKKTRVSTPKQGPAAPPRAPPKSAESVVPPSSAPAATPTAPTGITTQQAMIILRHMDPQLNQARAQLEQLRQQNRIQDLENLQRALKPKLERYYRLKQFVAAQMKAAAASNTAPPNSSGPTAEAKVENATGPSEQNTNTAAPGPSTNVPQQPQQIPSAQAIQQVLQARQSQQLNQPLPNLLPQFSPNIAAQMQKLQAKEGIAGLSAMPHHQSQPSQLPMNQPGRQTLPNLPPSQSSGPNENKMWLGTLSWMNPQTMTQTEIQVQMVANKNIQPLSWPSTFEIELLRDQAVPLPALKEWVSRYLPVLCQIRPYSRSIEPQENTLRYKTLSNAIHERNIYAIGRRVPAAENLKPLMLVFHMGGDGTVLAAAVFPESGIPDLPKVNPQAQTVPQIRPPGPNINPQVMAMLQNLAPEQKMQFLARLRHQRQHQRMQQAQSQSQAQLQQTTGNANANAASMNPSNPNPNPLLNVPGGWPAASVTGGPNLPNAPNFPPGMNPNNLAAALMALQQQRGMQPGSGGAL